MLVGMSLGGVLLPCGGKRLDSQTDVIRPIYRELPHSKTNNKQPRNDGCFFWKDPCNKLIFSVFVYLPGQHYSRIATIMSGHMIVFHRFR